MSHILPEARKVYVYPITVGKLELNQLPTSGIMLSLALPSLEPVQDLKI